MIRLEVGKFLLKFSYTNLRTKHKGLGQIEKMDYMNLTKVGLRRVFVTITTFITLHYR